MTLPRDEALSHDVRAAMEAVVRGAMGAHERSQQVSIGASEIGTPCTRKLAFKLRAMDHNTTHGGGSWSATVGTAGHTWLEQAFRKENLTLGWDRWLTETELECGEFGGRILPGHGDLYDRLTATVVDFKIPGATTMKKVHGKKHPGGTYRTQVHLYGKGYVNLGLPVEHVAVWFLPSGGELSAAFYWTEPFDMKVADAALLRAGALVGAAQHMPWEQIIPKLDRSDDYCTFCPFQSHHATVDSGDKCPGDDAMMQRRVLVQSVAAFGEVGGPRG